MSWFSFLDVVYNRSSFMIGLKDVLPGQNSGDATLNDCFGSSVLLESWIMMPFVTWRDAPERISGLFHSFHR